jgi:RHS repeat-associated protein
MPFCKSSVTTYEYDNLDRQVVVKQSNGLVAETVYDKQGRVWKSIIKVGNDVRITEYKYDTFGNIIETIQPDGTTIKAGYNNKGQKISETNQLGQTRTFQYDDNDQLIQVTLPDGATYKYAYDALGNQTSIIDPLNRETKFTYDDNGNQLTRTLLDGSIEYFEYDFKGRLIGQISFEGVITTYQYDNYNRLASKIFSTNGINETWNYTYDQFDRVSEIDQSGRIVKTTYDVQGRTKSIEMPEGIISYMYDEFGRQTSVQTDNDPPEIYGYDNFGRLNSVTSDSKTTIYEYDVFGNLAKTTLPNGVITTYEYDNMNRLVKETNYVDKNNNKIMDEGEEVSQFEYSLDKQGRKLSAKEKFWIEFGQQENNIDWIYDEAGRLIYEKFDHYDDAFDQTSEWIYDLVGNRLRQTVDKGNDGTVDEVTKYSYDKNDRLLKEQHDAQNDGNFEKTTTYGYDHTQQTSKTVVVDGIKLNETTYEYNLQGRMSIVTITTFNDDGETTRIEKTTYVYGEDGIRTSALHEIDVDGDGTFDTAKSTEYLNDPLNITGYSQVLKQTETDLQTNEQTVTTYVIGHQRISQTVIKNGSKQEYYFTFDGHGSTRALTDVVGAIIELYSYDAFGNALGFDSSIALTEFLYSGEQFDSKISQQYLRQRYYDPTTGRFNRLDPFFGNLSDPQSLHKYLYTHADPINGIDPRGLMSMGGFAIGLSIGLGIASVSGGIAASILGGYKSDGSLFGNAMELTGQTGLGIIQGWANIGNGIQDFGFGIYNFIAMLQNLQIFTVTLGLSPFYYPYFSSPDWSRGLLTHEYGDELERWEKWFCDTHNWSKFLGASGVITLATIGGSSTIAAFSKTPAKGVPESAKFCQRKFSENFSNDGRFAGRTIDDIVAALQSGKMKPTDVPIQIYVPENGNVLILNTRSAEALTRAGVPRSQWNALVINDDIKAMERMAGQLSKNKLSLEGFTNPLPSN